MSKPIIQLKTEMKCSLEKEWQTVEKVYFLFSVIKVLRIAKTLQIHLSWDNVDILQH